jgi:protein gp37
MARRLAGMKHTKEDYSQVITNSKWNGKTIFRPYELLKPKKWTKPQRIFITSMGDLFHDNVLDQWLIEIMFMVKNNPQHTFIMLTKRPKRALEFFTNCPISPFFEPLPNLWFGITIENQFQADKRIPILLQIPAVKHIISMEPLLGYTEIQSYLPSLDWIIIGAETGNRARIMRISWAESLYHQCKKANVPFFLKKTSDWAGENITNNEINVRQFPV